MVFVTIDRCAQLNGADRRSEPIEYVNDDFEVRLKDLHREMISKRKNVVESRGDLHLDATEHEERAANYRLASAFLAPD